MVQKPHKNHQNVKAQEQRVADRAAHKAVAQVTQAQARPLPEVVVIQKKKKDGKSAQPRANANVAEAKDVLACLAKSLMKPEDSAVYRYPSSVSGARTAVTKTSDMLEIDISQPFSGTTVAAPGVPEGTFIMFMFRNPLRAAVVYNKNPTHVHWGWDLYFSSPSNMMTNGITTTDTILPNGVQYDLPIASAKSRTDLPGAFTPHGPYLYPCWGLGKKAIWIDGDANYQTIVYFNASGLSSGTYTTCSIVAWQWAGRSWQQYSRDAFPAGTSTSTLPIAFNQRGYYAFSFVNTATSGVASLTVQADGSSDVFAHRAMVQFDQMAQQMGEARVLCYSVLLNNTSAELYRGGEIAGCQIGAGETWQQYTTYDRIANVSDAYRGPADRGIYGMDKLMDEYELRLRRPVVLNASGPIDYSWSLDEDSPFIAVAVKVATVSGTWPGGSFLGHLTTALEYKTEAQWISTDVPRITPEMYTSALMIKKGAAQFTENPLHLLAIGRAIMSGLSWALPRVVGFFANHGGKVATAASVVSGLAKSHEASQPPKGASGRYGPALD